MTTVLAPVDVYKVLKRYDDNGRLNTDFISQLARDIAALTKPGGESFVGEVGTMPGTTAFTMAVFKAEDVPVGTRLYALTNNTLLESRDKFIVDKGLWTEFLNTLK